MIVSIQHFLPVLVSNIKAEGDKGKFALVLGAKNIFKIKKY